MKLYSITDILGYKAYAQVFTLCPSPQEANTWPIKQLESPLSSERWLDCCSAIRRSLTVKELVTRSRKPIVQFLLVYADMSKFLCSALYCVYSTPFWMVWLTEEFPRFTLSFSMILRNFCKQVKRKVRIAGNQSKHQFCYLFVLNSPFQVYCFMLWVTLYVFASHIIII